MKDNSILGVDLGQKGGLCLFRGDQIMYTQVMPLNISGELDIKELKGYLLAQDPSSILVIFEDITPLHLASKKANWSLALQSGAVEALCIALDLKYKKIPAKVWQKEMFAKLPPLRAKTGESDTKGLALIAAKALFPNQTFLATPRCKVPHNGLVDATLLAVYGNNILNK